MGQRWGDPSQRVRLEPPKQRGFVEGQGVHAVEMAARFLPRRAGGMKYRRPLLRCQAGQFQFLEDRRRHKRDAAPGRHGLWRHFACPAKRAIGYVLSKLQMEQSESEFVE